MRKNQGDNAEMQALNFLKNEGMQLLERNYRCIFGEIDLIMQDQAEVVFIEVRYRTHTAFGDAIESIDQHKQQKLLKTATHFLQKKAWLDKVNCRFDVVGFSKANIEWIKDAFSYE